MILYFPDASTPVDVYDPFSTLSTVAGMLISQEIMLASTKPVALVPDVIREVGVPVTHTYVVTLKSPRIPHF